MYCTPLAINALAASAEAAVVPTALPAASVLAVMVSMAAFTSVRGLAGYTVGLGQVHGSDEDDIDAVHLQDLVQILHTGLGLTVGDDHVLALAVSIYSCTPQVP